MSILNSNGKYFADTRVVSLSGERGIPHTIVVQLEVVPEVWDPLAQILTLEADLAIQVGNAMPVRVGTMSAKHGTLPIRQYQERRPISCMLGIDLSRTSLEEIERRRGGGNVTLKLTFRGLMNDGNFTGAYGSDSREVNQSEWVELLDKLGFRKTLLLEVPVPHHPDDDGLKGAVDRLAEGQKAMAVGHYRDAVFKCRAAMEALATFLGEDTTAANNLGQAIKNNTQLNKSERFHALRRAATNITNPAAHEDSVAARIEWDYDDAAALLAIAASLIRRVVVERERGRG